VPIHDQGYRRYTGRRVARGRAWIVIARTGLWMFLKRRAFVGLLLLSWLPFIVRAVQLYAAANVPQVSFLAPTPRTFRQFLQQQDLLVFFMTVYVGAGLIANDRRANALQLYLSKPLTRAEYVFGKLAILMTCILSITWVPAILLLIVQMAFAGNFTFFLNNTFVFPAITILSLLEAAVAAISMLALSSLSNNSRYVGILYTALIFFGQALFLVLRTVTGDAWWSWISITNDVSQVGDVIFRLPLRNAAPRPLPLVAIAVVLLVSAFILERRVRGVEVVT
jgi:ABC-2 type transport system permease protein